MIRRAEQALRKTALARPEAYEEFPWGERAVKVRRKVFLFMSTDDDGLSVTVKLPTSHKDALQLPFAKPTGYGLGKSGWVTARFGPQEKPPLDVLRRWIEESYEAVAPRRRLMGL